MWVVAILTPQDGARELFEAYEHEAAQIMARHGGRMEQVIKESTPPQREVHLVYFPTHEAFDAYRADPDLIALTPQRAAAIAATELIFGD
jgi:uncharacterized protein (DUF1330 family)